MRFEPEAETGYCTHQFYPTRLMAKIGQIVPSSSGVVTSEALQVCKNDHEYADLKFDSALHEWNGMLAYNKYVTEFEHLADHRERVVGFKKIPYSIPFSIKLGKWGLAPTVH